MKTETWIELVDKGVANRFNYDDENIIEVNWRLSQHPELFSKILEHELEHVDGRYKFKDLLLDFKTRTPGLHKFMLNHISTWTQVLPFYYDKKKKSFVYDISVIANWIFVVVTAYLIFKLLTWLF